MANLVVDLEKAEVDLADLAGVLPAIVKVARFYATRNTRALLEADQAMMDEWALQHRQAAAEQGRMLRAAKTDLASLNQRLDELTSDPGFTRVCKNYGYEACREAIDERRRMLAFAAAGSANVDLTIAQLARVERVVREVDPPDVFLLAALKAMPEPERPPPGDHPHYRDLLEKWQVDVHKIREGRLSRWNGSQPSGHILAACGCVHIQTTRTLAGGSPSGLIVTPLGEWVLSVLRVYLAMREEESRRA
jgi:hypothetical protein